MFSLWSSLIGGPSILYVDNRGLNTVLSLAIRGVQLQPVRDSDAAFVSAKGKVVLLHHLTGRPFTHLQAHKTHTKYSKREHTSANRHTKHTYTKHIRFEGSSTTSPVGRCFHTVLVEQLLVDAEAWDCMTLRSTVYPPFRQLTLRLCDGMYGMSGAHLSLGSQQPTPPKTAAATQVWHFDMCLYILDVCMYIHVPLIYICGVVWLRHRSPLDCVPFLYFVMLRAIWYNIRAPRLIITAMHNRNVGFSSPVWVSLYQGAAAAAEDAAGGEGGSEEGGGDWEYSRDVGLCASLQDNADAEVRAGGVEV